MGKRLVFLFLFGSLAGLAAGAAAAPPPVVFQLSITGVAHAQWDHTTAPDESGPCVTSQRSEGRLSARFGSRRPTLVRVVGGRFQPVDVRPIDGTVMLQGPNTHNEVCPATESHTIEACPPTTLTFRDATTHSRSSRPASVTFTPVRVALGTIECPREPNEVRAAPLGPAPGPLRISTAALANPRVTRITLSASASRRITYGPLEQGSLLQTALWRFTLVRVGT